MPHGSVLRIEPVKARRDDSPFECVATNGIGEPATAQASLEVYPEGQGIFFSIDRQYDQCSRSSKQENP